MGSFLHFHGVAIFPKKGFKESRLEDAKMTKHESSMVLDPSLVKEASFIDHSETCYFPLISAHASIDLLDEFQIYVMHILRGKP